MMFKDIRDIESAGRELRKRQRVPTAQREERRTLALKATIVLTIVATLLAWCSWTVLANHSMGDSAWISKTVWSGCCGIDDCRRVIARPGPRGWIVRHPFGEGTFTVAYGNELPSENHHFWACFDLEAKGMPLRCLTGIDDYETRAKRKCCLFAPGAGS